MSKKTSGAAKPAAKESENRQFSERLRQALRKAARVASPTGVANAFNLRFWGRPVSVYAVRKWLMGASMPTQDKLTVLAEWLSVEPHWLRFGTETAQTRVHAAQIQARHSAQDNAFLEQFYRLNEGHRQAVKAMMIALQKAERAAAKIDR